MGGPEDWEEANRGVLTDDGKEIITDKEVEERLDSLNSQIGLIDEKNKLIEETEDLRKPNQLNVLRISSMI